MADGVKRRRYESPRRREQAAATRRAILDAAQALFERDGYAATTIAAVAREAGVATKTVYLGFETKSGLLRALWHLLLRGDEDDVPIGERAWYRAMLDEPDPARRLAMGARGARTVKERAGGLLRVIRTAALVDADAAGLWARIESDFHANQRAIVETVHRDGALRRGLGVARATDILWTLNHPDLWHLLVGERGWTPEEWEQWFADTSSAQLLRPH
jgi:AcrR family transcriptional regulator